MPKIVCLVTSVRGQGVQTIVNYSNSGATYSKANILGKGIYFNFSLKTQREHKKG